MIESSKPLSFGNAIARPKQTEAPSGRPLLANLKPRAMPRGASGAVAVSGISVTLVDILAALPIGSSNQMALALMDRTTQSSLTVTARRRSQP
jgi:hypothetical protein